MQSHAWSGIDAVLFDMDGTILSSVEVVERVWSGWALRHGLDPKVLLPTIHGARALDTIRNLALPGVDAVAEAAALTEEEIADVAGIHAIAGAADFLAALPPERWTVVTSAPLELARRRITAAGLPVPAKMVTAEDVARGKPAPDCFLLGAARLGARPERCLVLEDSPAGIAAADAAGMAVVVVTTTHAHPLATPHPSIADYTRLRARMTAIGKLDIGLDPA